MARKLHAPSLPLAAHMLLMLGIQPFFFILIIIKFFVMHIVLYLYVDGTEVNGERNVTICGLPDTVE